MKITFHVLAAASLSVFAVHCSSTSSTNGGGGTTADTGSAASALEFCQSVCTRVNTCDESQDVDTCTNECSSSFASLYPKLRADFVANVQTCWQRKDCKHVLGSRTVFSSCVAEAVESIAPSAAGSDLCDSIDSSEKKCDATLDRASCLSIVKRYNDTAIGSATKCVDKACTDIMPCVDSALDLTESSSSGSSGPGAPKK